jgi:hypothetical protein
VLTNPKVMTLQGDAFKLWCCCLLAAKLHRAGGVLPPVARLAFLLHASPDRIGTLMGDLIAVRLVDQEGDDLKLHDWDEWQRVYPSESRDAVAERVRNHRHLNGVTSVTNVTSLPTVTTRNERNGPRLDEIRGEEIRREKPPPLSPSGGSARGTRIPPDFSLDEGDLDYAREHGVSDGAARTHLEGFKLHFEQATKNYSSTDWHKRWKTRLLASLSDGRLKPDLAVARVTEAEPVAMTPAEESYLAITRVLREGAPAGITEVAVAQALGGLEALRAAGVPSYSDWVAAWNSRDSTG